MSYAFLSARYANADESAAIAETQTAGPVALSAVDTPAEWASLLASGISIEPFQPPAAVVPVQIQRHQGLLALLEFGITEAEIMEKVGQIEDAVEAERTRIRFQQPNWRRDSEFIAWGAGEFNLTSQQVDQLFTLAATF